MKNTQEQKPEKPLHILTVGARHFAGKEEEHGGTYIYPELRICGNWFRDAGFEIGARVEVTESDTDRSLVIRVLKP